MANPISGAVAPPARGPQAPFVGGTSIYPSPNLPATPGSSGAAVEWTDVVDTPTTLAGYGVSPTDPEIPQPATTVPLVDSGTGAVGSGTTFARNDHAHPIDTSRAPLASPAFTGTPTAPTQTPGDDSTKLATTAYVDTSFFPKSGGALSGSMSDLFGITASGVMFIAGSLVYGTNVATLSANIVLTYPNAGGSTTAGTSSPIQLLNAGGATWTVTLPSAPASNSATFYIVNTGTSGTLVVQYPSGTTLITLAAGQYVHVMGGSGTATWRIYDSTSLGLYLLLTGGTLTGPLTLASAGMTIPTSGTTPAFIGPNPAAVTGNPLVLRVPSSTGGISIGMIDASNNFLGPAFQAFGNSQASFPGQMYFDAGNGASAASIFRWGLGGTIAEKMRVDTTGLKVTGGDITMTYGFHLGTNSQTISANLQLTRLTAAATSAHLQLITASAASLVVLLPASPVAGDVIRVYNTGNTNTFAVQNAGGTVITASLAIGTGQQYIYSGSAWLLSAF